MAIATFLQSAVWESYIGYGLQGLDGCVQGCHSSMAPPHKHVLVTRPTPSRPTRKTSHILMSANQEEVPTLQVVRPSAEKGA